MPTVTECVLATLTDGVPDTLTEGVLLTAGACWVARGVLSMLRRRPGLWRGLFRDSPADARLCGNVKRGCAEVHERSSL